MTSPAVTVQYRNRYPRSGRVAVLCEGDLAGYEADLLAKWTAREGFFVDVWPCGTRTALRGMADAIGRAIPIVVIEDRDFRIPKDAEDDCKKVERSRSSRGVSVVAWRTWIRHEIENYLIEPDVVAPPLAAAFGASEKDIHDALDHVIHGVGASQAARWALSEFHDGLPDPAHFSGDPTRNLPQFTWDDPARDFRAPDTPALSAGVRKTVEQHATLFAEKAKKLAVESILEGFEERLASWSKETLQGNAWRVDWGGKEVLQLLYRLLAARWGWPSEDGEKEPVHWSALAEKRLDRSLDLRIEHTLQRDIVASFLEFLNGKRDEAILGEWNGLLGHFVNAAQGDE